MSHGTLLSFLPASLFRSFLLCFSLSAVTLQAETAQEIADRIVYARGGEAKLKAIQTERMTGELVRGDQQGSFVIEVKRPNKIRVEINLDGNNSVKAFDGKTGWQTSSPGQRTPDRMPENETKELSGETDIDGPFLDFNSKGTQIELVDKEMLGSSLAWKLKVRLKNGAVSYYYVESTGYFILLREQIGEKGEGPAVIRQSYQKFQRVENVLFPLEVIAEQSGSDVPTRLKFENIELNIPEEDSRFTLTSDKGGKPAKP